MGYSISDWSSSSFGEGEREWSGVNLEGLAGESGQKCLEFEGVLKGEGIFCRSDRGDPRKRPG